MNSKEHLTSKWLHKDDPALKEAVFALFDKEKDSLQGLLSIWSFIKTANIPESDRGNIFFWMVTEKGVSEECFNDFDSIVRKFV